jgi:hypothetical protein
MNNFCYCGIIIFCYVIDIVVSVLQLVMNLVDVSQNAVKTQFPKMVLLDAIYLAQMLTDVLTKIGLLFNIKIDSFVEQLALNDYKNCFSNAAKIY